MHFIENITFTLAYMQVVCIFEISNNNNLINSNIMKTFNIYKKRDGQDWKNVSYIYADNFDEACKKFAKQMTEGNHELSNNIQWLDKEEDGVNETGWYDFNGGDPDYNLDTEKYDADEAADFLLVSETEINEGFSRWNEDVYTWEIREEE